MRRRCYVKIALTDNDITDMSCAQNILCDFDAASRNLIMRNRIERPCYNLKYDNSVWKIVPTLNLKRLRMRQIGKNWCKKTNVAFWKKEKKNILREWNIRSCLAYCVRFYTLSYNWHCYLRVSVVGCRKGAFLMGNVCGLPSMADIPADDMNADRCKSKAVKPRDPA